MASDFGTPVADQVAPATSGLQTLSALMGLKQQQLKIEQAQAGVQEAQATAQQQTQTAQQRSGLAQFWSQFSPSNYTGPDGTISVDKFLADPKARAAAGDMYPAVVDSVLKVKNQQLTNQQALVNLNDSTRKQLFEMAGGLRTDPDVIKDNPAGRAKVQGALNDFASTSPAAARAVSFYATHLPNLPRGSLPQALSGVQLQAMSAGQQAQAQQPIYLGTGAAAVNVNPQAPGGNLGGSPPVRMAIPPGMHTFTDQAGNTWGFNPQDPSHATLVGHGPVGGGSAGASGAGGNQATRAGGAQASNAAPSSASGPPVLPVGGQQNANVMAHTDAQTYTMVRTAANEAPATKNILHNIDILSGETKTGIGSKDIADAETALGQYVPGFASLQNAAAKRQLLGKYTEQLAMRVTEANGYGTDQARNLVTQAIPNPNNMGQQAIQQASRFIMAQTEIGQARGAAANRFVQAHGGSSLGLQAFDSRFMQAIDPRMFDYIGLPAKERGQWLQKNFQSKDAAKTFIDRMALVAHDGGLDYSSQ